MKKLKNLLAFAMVLAIVLSISAFSAAADHSNGLAGLPAGIYTYVHKAPSAEKGSGEGQLQFVWAEKKLVWAFGGVDAVNSGSRALSGDALDFFEGLYISDRPVTDWLGGATKNVEGYAGEVAGNVQIILDASSKISTINVTNAKTRALAILTKDITAAQLTVIGITRGRPNLLQSCITIMGSTNGLYLTKQGDVVLDGLTIGHDASGVGLKADKIGGDTFNVGTVAVDGKVEWNNKMGVIFPLDSQPGTLVTNGQDITMTGGSNIGRVGRVLNISTGEGGGNITLGATVSTDSTRGGLSPTADTSADGVTINTSGKITAGTGNVVIGTNTEKAVIIDLIGSIQGENVTIKPDNRGKVGNITGAIGSITATKDIEIEIGSVNSGSADSNTNAVNGFAVWQSTANDASFVVGNMISENGNVSFKAGAVNGHVGSITAPKGSASVTIASAESVGSISAASIVKDIGTITGTDCSPTAAAVTVDGKATEFGAYNIQDNNYFKLRDLAYMLSGTEKQFEVSWDEANNAITLNSGKAYTPMGGEMSGAAAAGVKAVKASVTITLDGKEITLTAYNIGGNNYFKLRDVGQALNFGVEWDSKTNTIGIDSSKGYAA